MVNAHEPNKPRKQHVSAAVKLIIGATTITSLLLGSYSRHADAALSTRSKSNVTIDTVTAYRRLSQIALSHDGRYVLYSQISPLPTAMHGTNASLYRVDLVTGRRALLTTKLVSQFAWSPRDDSVAFLSDDGSGAALWVIDLGDHAVARKIAQIRKDAGGATDAIASFAYSPDGLKIAVVRTHSDKEASKPPPSIVLYGTHRKALSLNAALRYSSSLDILDAKSDIETALPFHFQGIHSVSWSRDSRYLVMLPNNPAYYGGSGIYNNAPVIVDTESKTAHPVPKLEGAGFRTVAWSPTGSTIAYVTGVGDKTGHAILSALDLFNVRSNRSRQLAGPSSFIAPYTSPPTWSENGRLIFALGVDDGTTHLYVYDVTTGVRREISPLGLNVQAFDVTGNGEHIVAIMGTASHPSDVYTFEAKKSTWKRITDFSGAFRSSHVMPIVKTVHWRSGDNVYDVHGYLILPPGYQSNHSYPIIVSVHGGPAGAYEDDFYDAVIDSESNLPAGVLAARGYVVLEPNPRGDPGYSVAYAKALVGHLCISDVEEDIIPGIRFLISRGIVNPHKVGITGFSYGGCSVAWAITHSKMFRVASIDEGPVDFLSYYGTAYDVNSLFMDYYFGGNATEHPRRYMEHSPIFYTSKLSTPTLLRYANEGGTLRTPSLFDQGKEFYRALEQRHVPNEFIIDPYGTHVFHSMQLYRDYVQRSLAWFARWLHP